MPKKHAHFARQTAAPRSWKTKRWWKLPESRSKWNLPGTGAVGGREMSRGRSFNWHHAGGHRCGRSSSMKGGGGKELSRWCELVESWLWWQLPLQGVGASSSWTFKSSLFFQIIDFHFRYFRLMIPFLNIVQRIWHLQRYLSQVRLRRRLGRWLRLDATSNKAGNSTRQSSGHQHLEHLGSCGADGWGERALARWDLVYIYLFIYVAVRWLVLCVRFKLKIVAADGNDDVGHGGDDEGWKRRPGNGTFAEAFALQRWYHRKRCQRGQCWASPQDCQEKEPPTPQPQIQNLVRSSWNMLKLCQRQGRPTSHATQGKPMGPTYGAKGAGNPTADSECLGISTLDLHQIERNLWE